MSMPLLSYKGIWNGYLNSPVLTDGEGELGDAYLIANNNPENGQQLFIIARNLGSGIKSWLVTTYIYYDGSQWQPYSPTIGSTGTVTSVAATNGIGILVTGGPITTSGTLTITNTLPDLTVAISGSTGILISGTYPNFVVTNTSPSSGGTVTSLNISGSTGISTTGGPITTNGVITIVNTAPDKIVAISGSTGISISGTYPSFVITNSSPATGNYITSLTGDVTAAGPGSVVATIASNAVTYAKMQAVSGTSRLLGSSSTTTPVQELSIGSGLLISGTTLTSTGSGGTVTSINISGSTGISTSGGPITTSGTITITNSAPDLTVQLSGSTGIAISGTYPSFTITNTAPSITSGTVTSVGLSLPAELTVSNSPVTTSGTLTAVWVTQGANKFFIAPSGSTGVPSFRVITTRDLGTGTANSSTYLRGDLTWAALTTSPAGATTQVQFNNAGTLDGSTNVTIDLTDKNLILLSTSGTTAVTTPASGLKVWGDNRTGVDQLHLTPVVGIDTIIQNSFGQKVISFVSISSALSGVNNFVGPSNAGSTSEIAKVYDATNLLPNYANHKNIAAVTANSSAELFWSATGRGAILGNNVYGGGVKWIWTGGFPVYSSGQRIHCGYTNTASQNATTTDPSAWLNFFGLAKDAADTTLQFMCNAGSGTATKVNTGITPNTNDVYRVTLIAPSNSTTVYCTLERFTKSAVTIFNTSFTGAKLMTGTLIYTHLMVNCAASGIAVAIATINLVEEQY